MSSSSSTSLSLTNPHLTRLTSSPSTTRLSSLPSTITLNRSPTPTTHLSQSHHLRHTAIHASVSAPPSTTTDSSLVEKSVNTIRFLAVDSVEKANSGHPGLPMGCAPMGHVLYDEVMRYNPKNPFWFNRDRFVLSAGHGCMLQYALLHLAGYDSVKVEDLKQFRQWESRTPGHPENFETPGIEVTTGPLGQGIANAVGLALAEKHLAARFNKPDNEIIDHYTYCILGDGCQMEGIANEACSLAGHWGLGKLIAFYDDNHISIDGDTEIAFTESVEKRFEGLGWHVIWVKNGNTGFDEIRAAIKEAKAVKDRPTLIKFTTTIGYGSPNKSNSYSVHGSALGAKEVDATRNNLGWPYEPFHVPEDVKKHWSRHIREGAALESEWNAKFADYEKKYKEEAAVLKSIISGDLPAGWEKALPTYTPEIPADATRNLSQQNLNALANVLPGLIGGSADLASSNMTLLKKFGDFQSDSPAERNVRFGVREHGMGAICNGIALHSRGLIPYCATFFVFTDYMRGAIRLSALSEAGVIYVMTHDSIGLGEDGPTHQPIEHLASFRAMPNILMLRPADGNETAGAYKVAVLNRKRPSILALSRQKLPNQYNTIWYNSKLIAAVDSSTHNNERIKCDNIYDSLKNIYDSQPIPSLSDSSTPSNSKSHSSLHTFEPAKVAAENDRSVVDATISLEIDQTMKKRMDSLHLVPEGVLAWLTQLETRTHHLERSMDDLKVSVGRQLENILSEVQNVKDKQDILQAQLETQTSVISNLVQQALSLSASAPLQSQQYLPQSIHVVSTAIAPPQHGLPSPIQLPNQFPQIPNPTVLQRDPYLPPPVQSQEIPNQQYQLPLIQQPRPQSGALPHQQYQQTPHSQYSQPGPHLPQQQLPHSSGNPPQLQSSMGHRLEEPPYAPFQNYPPNLRHPPTLPQGYEPLSSISGASYSSGYDTLPGPAEPNRYGRPPQYGTPPQGYEPPSSRFGASYSSRYDTLSEIAEPNRYGGPPQYGGKQPQLHTASVAYISGSGHPQLPTAYILPQAIPTESSVSFGSGSPGAGNRVSVDHVVEKVATMGFPREHVRAIVRKLTKIILILLFLYHLFLFLGY